MTAIANANLQHPRAAGAARAPSRAFATSRSKDFAEWFRTRRFLWTTIAATALVTSRRRRVEDRPSLDGSIGT